MEFGILSNGFRPHTSAGQTYDEDISEIVLADQLGFRDAYISEHHGEPPHINYVDTIPTPELMMCKAAALTKQIRMGAAVKLLHLQHPVDVAVQAAVTDHLIGNGRFIFGFGTGFGNPAFCEERGLTFEDRHERLHESLDVVLKCWETEQPFDFEGKYWQGKKVLALPKPVAGHHMPMATATEQEDMIKLAAERGYILLSAFIDTAQGIKARNEKYLRYARAAGHGDATRNLSVSRLIYIADSKADAIEDMRDAVEMEVGVQAKRGFLKHLKARYNVDVPNDRTAIDCLVENGIYIVGSADEVAERLIKFHGDCGGWGTLLMTVGKDWATHEKRARSMKTFMEQVAPRLRALEPAAQLAAE
jgi:alkanesulfonate monooxygenase SsuD/methylene tetrahydromethanopterin reductase-like flavin-dependent oxidoreductase (luciferase family)